MFFIQGHLKAVARHEKQNKMSSLAKEQIAARVAKNARKAERKRMRKEAEKKATKAKAGEDADKPDGKHQSQKVCMSSRFGNPSIWFNEKAKTASAAQPQVPKSAKQGTPNKQSISSSSGPEKKDEAKSKGTAPETQKPKGDRKKSTAASPHADKQDKQQISQLSAPASKKVDSNKVSAKESSEKKTGPKTKTPKDSEKPIDNLKAQPEKVKRQPEAHKRKAAPASTKSPSKKPTNRDKKQKTSKMND